MLSKEFFEINDQNTWSYSAAVISHKYEITSTGYFFMIGKQKRSGLYLCFSE